MMDIQPLLAYNTWLSLPRETRHKLEQLFSIPRTGEVIVRSGSVSSAGNIQGEVTSDGHSAKDLYAITVEKMQEYTGSKHTDFYALFSEVLEKIDGGSMFYDDNRVELEENTKTSEIKANGIQMVAPKRRGRPAKAK